MILTLDKIILTLDNITLTLDNITLTLDSMMSPTPMKNEYKDSIYQRDITK